MALFGDRGVGARRRGDAAPPRFARRGNPRRRRGGNARAGRHRERHVADSDGRGGVSSSHRRWVFRNLKAAESRFCEIRRVMGSLPLGSLTALSPARARRHRWRLRPGARARRSRRGARARRGRGGSRRAARALASPSARPPVSGAIVASFRRGANGWTGATSEALVAIETRASARPLFLGAAVAPRLVLASRRAAGRVRARRVSRRGLRPPPARAFIDLPSRLHNRYFLVRHGESTLETRGLVLSNPSFKYDTTYGLTRAGWRRCTPRRGRSRRRTTPRPRGSTRATSSDRSRARSSFARISGCSSRSSAGSSPGCWTRGKWATWTSRASIP